MQSITQQFSSVASIVVNDKQWKEPILRLRCNKYLIIR